MTDPQAEDLEKADTQPVKGTGSADAKSAESAGINAVGTADAQAAELHRILQQMSVHSDANSEDTGDDSKQGEDTKSKKSLKETVKHEAQEIFIIFIYLGFWLSVFATMKCLVLLQYGINEFKNAYVMAWITAITFAKVIVVAQKLPLVEKMKHRPLFWACVYKSCFFTMITLAAHRAEERLTHMANDPNNVFPLAGVVAHTISLFGVFLFLFAYRDLDVMLGKGTLRHMFFKSRRP